AGEIIAKTTLLEIISIVANSNWRGDLLVYAPDGFRRRLVFDQGALKYAESSAPVDQLAEVLFRQGTLSGKDKDSLKSEFPNDLDLGRACVDRGLLSSDDL